MDQRERYPDLAEAFRIALEALQTRIWTAIPCVVQAFPAASGLDAMMLDAQPLIAGSYVDSKGVTQVLQMPLLTDIPVCWQGGGGVTLTFPIVKGDECLVIFGSRCIDAWWQLGVGSDPKKPAVPPPNSRLHNLSDGFALVGVRSLPRSKATAANIIDPLAAGLYTDNGEAAIQISALDNGVVTLSTNGGPITIETDTGNVNVTSSQGNITVTTDQGEVNINGVTIDQNGNVNSPATITATTDVIGGGKHLKTHTHSGVQTGSGTSGPPS